MRIVFMGTPEFAVPSLAALLSEGFEVAAAVTQPDKPSGRGNRLTPCPVKALAESRGVPVLQFEKIRRREGVEALSALLPDLFVTAAFGQILSQRVLDIPRLGTVNVHASLLPRYRGPAPINWCVINGEAETGVTTMMTDAGVDTGDILLRRALPILPGETAEALSVRLSALGAALLIDTLRLIEVGSCPRAPQDHDSASRHPMLTKELGRIDWSWPAERVECLVRGTIPWPGAYTALPGGAPLKIWKARIAPGEGAPGAVLLADAKSGLRVACGEGALDILELQAPGAKRMDAKDYLRGRLMAQNTVLGIERPDDEKK